MKFEDAEIRINLFDDILDAMSEEQRLELAKLLCFNDTVLDHLVDQLARDYASETMDSNIHHARLKLVELMPELAAQTVRALVDEVQCAKSRANRYWNDYWKLCHAWPEHPDPERCFRRPEMAKYESITTPMADTIMRKCGLAPIESAEVQP